MNHAKLLLAIVLGCNPLWAADADEISLVAPALKSPGTSWELTDFIREARMAKVQVKTVGPLILLVGEVDTATELDSLHRVVRGLQNAEPKVAVENLVQLTPDAWKALADKIERTIGSQDITCRFVNTTLFLEGIAENDYEADRAVVIAQASLAVLHGGGTSVKPQRILAGDPASAAGAVLVDLLRIRPMLAATPPLQKD